VGSWFVPSARYDTSVELVVEGWDLHRPRRSGAGGAGAGVGRTGIGAAGGPAPTPAQRRDWVETVPVRTRDTSLFDRSARWTEYLFTIIVPPIVLRPGEPERLGASLTEKVNDELARALKEALRARLEEVEWSRPVSIAFIHPDPLVALEEDSARLELGIANPGPGKIRSLEVVREAPGAAPARWQAARADLERLASSLGKVEEPGDYAPFTVPAAIPLAKDLNVLKVRAVIETGEELIRTMVYFH
jgi:hypothetical protein